jgi:uncharacterized protein YndB with AHSA1/START domain
MSDRVQREAVLPATRERLWAQITGDGWLAERVELDLWPGGEARFESAGVELSGWVEEAAAPERLTFWWARDDEPATRVELALEEVDEELTRLRISETRPLDVLDLIGIPLGGLGGRPYGPAMLAGVR